MHQQIQYSISSENLAMKIEKILNVVRSTLPGSTMGPGDANVIKPPVTAGMPVTINGSPEPIGLVWFQADTEGTILLPLRQIRPGPPLLSRRIQIPRSGRSAFVQVQTSAPMFQASAPNTFALPEQSRKRKMEEDIGPSAKYRRTLEGAAKVHYRLTTKSGATEVRSFMDIERLFKSDRSETGLQNVNEYVDIMKDLVTAISSKKLLPGVATIDDVVAVGLAAIISAKRYLDSYQRKGNARALSTYLVSAATSEPVLSKALKRALKTRSFPKFSELGITDRMNRLWEIK